MELKISFNELIDYVSAKHSKDIKMEYVDTKTVKASVKVSMKILSVWVPVTLTVKAVEDSAVSLAYSGTGVDLVITGVLKFLRGKNDELDSIVKYNGDSSMTVDLAKVKRLEKAFAAISLTDIEFEPDYVIVKFNLKY